MLADRTLTLSGAARFLVFNAAENLDALAELPAGPAIVLGGFARTDEGAERFAEAMGSRFALLLPGGLDDPDFIDDAISANAIDLRGVHRVVLPGGELVVVPGAFDGRLAIGDDACGFGAADLTLLQESLEGEIDRRWWLSWEAPLGTGAVAPDLGFEGAHVGAQALLDLGGTLGIAGGVFGYPETQAGLGSADLGTRAVPADEFAPDLSFVAPTLGRVVERADESRTDGSAAWVEFGAEGMRWSAVVAE